MRTEPFTIAEISKYDVDSGYKLHVSRIIEALGFRTLIAPNLSIIEIWGTKWRFESVFETRLQLRHYEVSSALEKYTLEYYQPEASISLPSSLRDFVEYITFPVSPIFLGLPTAIPPPLTYYHLVPNEIFQILDAKTLHLNGTTGAGIKLTMIDTGFWMHPYYQARFYKITQIGGASDDYGHGTAIASNALSLAPDCNFVLIKMFGTVFDAIAAYIEANLIGSDVITNSWGWPEELILIIIFTPLSPFFATLRLLIDLAILSGRTVLFAGGNGGLGVWPGSLPEVISVGGVYIDEDDSLYASSYASSYDSLIYWGRHVPDLCGIVGQAPHGMLIEMPTQPRSTIDQETASWPDGTALDDGWCVASGTSSATPQVAGVVALILQLGSQERISLPPTEIKLLLESAATDVTDGYSANGDRAGPGWDRATGYGLVNAEKAAEAIIKYTSKQPTVINQFAP